jgi:hypothetical protein
MKSAYCLFASLVLLAAPAIAVSSSNGSGHPATTGSSSRPAMQGNRGADYQTWVHRHDGLRQFNPPSQTQQQQRDYNTWLHRHDGLRQFNPPPTSSGSSFR